MEFKATTVAGLREEANKIILKLAEELEKKTAEDAQHTAEINGLKEMIKLHEDESNHLKKIVEGLEKQAADLKAASKTAEAKPDTTGLIEVVALQDDVGVELPPLIHNGKTAIMTKDEDGYRHYFVERAYANILLTSTSGLRFALVGPEPSITAPRMFGVRSEDVKILKHAKRKENSGAIHWVPVIEEDSVD